MPKDRQTTSSIETQIAAEQFLYRQAEIIDEQRWDEWLALFTEDGKYWMPAEANQEIADGVPNIFYEDLFLMEMRIKRVLHPLAHSQAPVQRLSRVVSNVIIESEDASNGDVVVRSKFFLEEFRLEEQRFFSGKYRHTLVNVDDGYRIKMQRVDITNVEGPFDYVMQTFL